MSPHLESQSDDAWIIFGGSDGIADLSSLGAEAWMFPTGFPRARTMLSAAFVLLFLLNTLFEI